ncbi:MAG: hypothetical protein WB509_01125, partial [Acetobacteraceae bacterium]
QADGVGYNLAFIGADFYHGAAGALRPRLWRALCDYGFHKARHGYDLAKHPPCPSQGLLGNK